MARTVLAHGTGAIERRPSGWRKAAKSWVSEPAELDSIQKAGWLRRQSQHMKRWKRRYCVLTPRVLLTFRSKAASRNIKNTTSVMVLDSLAARPGTRKDFSFDVKTADGNFLFVAESELERDNWLRSIDRAVCAVAAAKLASNGLDRLDWLRSVEQPAENPEAAISGEVNTLPDASMSAGNSDCSSCSSCGASADAGSTADNGGNSSCASIALSDDAGLSADDIGDASSPTCIRLTDEPVHVQAR